MKILVVCHSFNNFGGIINHVEHLIAGLKELNHTVNFAFIKPNKTEKNISSTELKEKYEIGVGTGLPVHQGNGWLGSYYALLSKESVDRFVSNANKHDLVIWESIFGFKNSATEKYTYWTKMITDVKAKQLVVIHDGNLKKLYSWIHKFESHFTGIACVHPSALKSAEFLTVSRNLILNPQEIPTVINANFDNRSNTIISPQTFKRWKRVDDLIAAVPYINSNIIVAGDGMERAYMTSIDKCKPEYYCTKSIDPEATEDRLNKPIWKNAETTGRFSYVGFLTENELLQKLSTVKFLIDPSWSKTYGEHFNRVIIDAMRTGTVPIARNLGVSDNEDGIGSIVKPNINYCMIPYNTTPKQFGDKVNEYLKINKSKYEEMVTNNKEILYMFDRKKIAEQYINLANGEKNAGILEKSIIGNKNIDQKAVSTGDNIWETHFEPPTISTIESFF